MKRLTSEQLRTLYLDFFHQKGHAIIKSASLIPENDPTVLFTTAGMHPLVPYLMGAPHPMGKRLANVQKCVRTGDIDEVGDPSHLTFFEMLGNWSLGDYFKEDAIAFSWEFLTSPDYLGIDADELAVSVFEGEPGIPRDTESFDIWRRMGVAEDRIFFLPRENNWWGPAGLTGPCGPDTEMFIIRDQAPCGPGCSPACDCGRYLEIWNDVFMQYNKTAAGAYEPLAQQNVDTGMGLERTVCVLQGVKTVYETDLFAPILEKIEALSAKTYGETDAITRAMRIVSDHFRTATFILGDERGVTPSNVDQGYVLRRLIRRATRFATMELGIDENKLHEIALVVCDKYQEVYPELSGRREHIQAQLSAEVKRFLGTIHAGMREFDKLMARLERAEGFIDGASAFRLYDTFGFPVELTRELARERGFDVDMDAFDAAFAQHQQRSKAGAEARFAGGLADAQDATTRLHTATHLLLAALRRALGDDIEQKGSNITAERLRFDFNFGRKLTAEELRAVEDDVNDAIGRDLPITFEEMTVEDALAQGAIGVFGERYGDRVRVYRAGDCSLEICGGPHAERTGELGRFKIQKEGSSSAGVRRIRAVLE